MKLTKSYIAIITLFFIAFPIVIGIAKKDKRPDVVVEDSLESSPLSDSQLYEMDSLLQRRLKRNGFRGTALVSYKNQIVMEYAHGYADYRSKEKIRLQSTFQLASVSKSFTSTSIMILKERGMLGFDDLVQDYIPEFPYEDVKIQHLLQHTSGLQNYMYLVDNYWKNDTAITNEDVLGLLIKYHLPLNNRPGRRFLYSNTGYVMLALIVERVSGQSFADFVQENVFIPSGMTSTYTYCRDIMDTISGRVIGYNRRGSRLYRYSFEPNDMVLGDKSIYSNVEDLFKYQKALNSYQLVSKETLEEAYTKGVTNSRYKKTFNYGYGWRLKDDNDNQLVYHNGLWHGFTSTLTREVSSDITIILLNNTTSHISAIKSDLLKIAKSELKRFGLHTSSKEIDMALVNDKQGQNPKS